LSVSLDDELLVAETVLERVTCYESHSPQFIATPAQPMAASRWSPPKRLARSPPLQSGQLLVWAQCPNAGFFLHGSSRDNALPSGLNCADITGPPCAISSVRGWPSAHPRGLTHEVALVSVVLGRLFAVHLCGAEPGNLRLDDLWEDTAATRISRVNSAFTDTRNSQSSPRNTSALPRYPEEANRPRASTVVFIHGGGWGRETLTSVPQCRYLACAPGGGECDYRLKSTKLDRECVTDCKSAIRYLRRNARPRIDQEKIVVVENPREGTSPPPSHD